MRRGPPAYPPCAGADAPDIVTEWEQFRALDFERLRGVMKQPVLVDLRNLYRPEDIESFACHGIGRPVAGASEASSPFTPGCDFLLGYRLRCSRVFP